MEARTITNPTTVIVADLDMNADLSPVEQTTSPTGLLESGFEDVTNYPPVETRTTTNQHSNRSEQQQTSTATDQNSNKPAQQQTRTAPNQHRNISEQQQTSTATYQNSNKPAQPQIRTATNQSDAFVKSL